MVWDPGFALGRADVFGGDEVAGCVATKVEGVVKLDGFVRSLFVSECLVRQAAQLLFPEGRPVIGFLRL